MHDGSRTRNHLDHNQAASRLRSCTAGRAGLEPACSRSKDETGCHQPTAHCRALGAGFEPAKSGTRNQSAVPADQPQNGSRDQCCRRVTPETVSLRDPHWPSDIDGGDRMQEATAARAVADCALRVGRLLAVRGAVELGDDHVPRVGLEPTTYDLRGRSSAAELPKRAPRGIRTPTLPVRSRMLCPLSQWRAMVQLG